MQLILESRWLWASVLKFMQILRYKQILYRVKALNSGDWQIYPFLPPEKYPSETLLIKTGFFSYAEKTANEKARTTVH